MAEEADPALVAVTTEDREAAAGYYRRWMSATGQFVHHIRFERNGAKNPLVQAFARHRLAAERCAQSEAGTGWVFWNPDAGEEYAPNHPVESGECCDAQRMRPSTPQEDVLWQAFQGEFERAHALETAFPASEAQGEAAAVLAEREACARIADKRRDNIGIELYTDRIRRSLAGAIATSIRSRSTTASADMVLVPREPTEAMRLAADRAFDLMPSSVDELVNVYRVMIAAAPSQISAGEEASSEHK